ncbi:MAG: hypothetical protein E6590_00750 [Clostridiales bacterium]|nr:hypothetical protein [Clostridiales bacterium]
MGIKHLRGAGMSIKVIKNYIGLCLNGESTIEERYDIILEQKNS